MESPAFTRGRPSRPIKPRKPLLLPNPWDAGTARLLAGLGFEALATTSLGVANLHGRRRASRREILDNCRAISEATPLPVNAEGRFNFVTDIAPMSDLHPAFTR